MAHNIVFLDRATIAPQIAIRRPACAHEWREYAATAPEQIAERACEADIVILNKVPFGAEEFARLPRLKLIAVAATGTDVVDKAAAGRAGVAVCNIRGYARAAVPEHVFALILALARSIVPYRDDVIAGEWQRARQFCFFSHRIMDLSGRRLAVFGSGSLGGRVAELGRAFGMNAVFVGRKGERETRPGYVTFDEALATADVMSLHCPLTEATRGLLGAAEFARMKKTPIIINTARGGVVDEAALEAALDAGQVAAAGFDVTTPEPPPADSVIMRLARRPDVIVTPHVAWASDEAQRILADQLIDNIESFVRGAPVNLVGP